MDCGPINVDFFNEIDETPLDPTLFSTLTVDEFLVLQSQDTDKTGLYDISYRVYPDLYPLNFEEKRSAFTIEIIDPCINDVTVTPQT